MSIDIPEPVNIQVEGKDNTVILSWAEPANNGATITEYSIYKRIVGDEEWKKVEDLKVKDGFKREYILELERGKNYELMVTATNAFGESAMNEDNIQTVEVPNLGEQRVESSKIIGGCHIHCIVLTMMKDHHTCKCNLPVPVFVSYESVFLFLSATADPNAQTGPTGVNPAIIAGAAAVGVLLILGLIILVIWRKRRKTPSESEYMSL